MKRILSILLTVAMVLSICTYPTMAASDATTADADALTIDDILSVPEWDGDDSVNTLIDNLDLDAYTKGEVNESSVTWISSNIDIISNSGIVTRGAEDATVTVTATIGEGQDAVEKEFTFYVPAAKRNINLMPTAGAVEWDDPFDGDTIISSSDYAEGYLTNFPGTATGYSIDENGKFVLFSQDWGTTYFIRRYINAISGTLACEFTVGGNSNYFVVQCCSTSMAQKPFDMICYRKTGKISVNGSMYAIPEKFKETYWKFTVYLDTNTDTLTMWLNNELFIENISFTADASNIAMFNAYMQASGQNDGRGTVLLDNIKIYEATECAVYADSKNAFDFYTVKGTNGKDYVVDNIDITPKKGSNGSSITYSISDSDVIASDGSLIRGVYDKDVIVTATISDTLGSTYVITKKITVPGIYSDSGLDLPPVKGEILNQITFDDEAIDSNITPININGNVTLTQANGALTLTSPYTNNEVGILLSESSPVIGKFVQEFELDTTSNSFRMRFCDAMYTTHCELAYLGAGDLRIAYYDEEDTRTTKTYSGTLRDKTKLTFLFDFTVSPGRMSVWINNNLFLDNVRQQTASSSVPNINYVYATHLTATWYSAWRDGKGTSNFYDYKLYRVVETSDNIDPDIYNAFDFDTVKGTNGKDYVVDNIDITPKKSSDGSSITYSISDSDVIASDGSLIRGVYDKDVIVTATIRDTSGSTYVITKKITVPGIYSDSGLALPPVMGEILNQITFDDETIDSSIKPINIDGTVTLTQANGALTLTSPYTNNEVGIVLSESSPVIGKFVQEFELDTTSNSFRMRFCDAMYTTHCELAYLGAGDLRIAYYDEEDTRTTRTYSGTLGDKTKLTFLFDFTVSPRRMSVWINNNLFLDNVRQQTTLSSVPNIKHVYATHVTATWYSAWRDGKGTSNFYDYKLYRVADSSVNKDPDIYIEEDGPYTIDGNKIHGFAGLTVGDLKENATVRDTTQIAVLEADEVTVASDTAQCYTGMIMRLTLADGSTKSYTLDIPHYKAEDVKVLVNRIENNEMFVSGNVAAAIDVTNYSNEPVGIRAIIAQYSNKDDSLLKVNTVSKKIKKGASSISAEFNIDDPTGTYIKAFSWADDKFMPLCKPKILTAFSSENFESVKFTYPGFVQKAVTFSYDDLSYDDAVLMSIFEKYGIKATFNLMTSRFDRMTLEELQNMYEGFDTISHSYSHPPMYITEPTVIEGETVQPLTYEEVISDIAKSQEDMTLLNGAETIGFAWPYNAPRNRSDYDDIMTYIRNNTAIKYCRPSDSSGDFAYPSDWYDWKTTCHHDNIPTYLPRFLETEPGDDLLLFSIWGHCYEFNSTDSYKLKWEDIEGYAKILGEDNSIWKADNTEIYKYKNAVDSAVVDYEANTITNNSNLDIYVIVNGLKIIIPANSVYTLKKETSNIVACWGDSLTWGEGATDWQTKSYPGVLQEMLPNMKVENLGVPGETAMTIAARQGAVVMKLDENIVIPADQTAVNLSFSAYNNDGSYAGNITPRNPLYGQWQPLSIEGIEGSLEVSINTNVFPRTLNYAKFARNKSGTSAIAAKKGTVIYPHSLEIARDAEINIFYTGTNGGWNAANTNPDDNEAADLIYLTNQMIAKTKKPSKFIVIGLKGTPKTNVAMKTAYGEHYIDIEEYMTSEQALADAGITPTETDLSYINNGKIPPSLLHTDGGHFNDAGYKLLATKVYEKMLELGYCE